MAQNFRPTTPTDGPSWLPRFADSVADLFRRILPAPLRLKDYATADLPAAAVFGQGMAWNSTVSRVTYSDGASWVQLMPYTAGAALTKTDDTNVTLTLGGSPATALLAATSLVLGWTGQLGVSRGGTGVGSLGSITKADDTNVTLTLGGTPAGAVINSTSFTLGWTGTLAVARGGTGGGSASGTLLDNITGFASTGIIARTGAGTYAFRTVTGTTNRLTVTNGDGVSGNPTLDISSSYAGQNTIVTVGTISTGTWQGTAVAAGFGGTGIASYAIGDILYASGSTALSRLADVATGNVLISGGVTTAPAWGKVGLTTHVSGTLPIANGGTNQTSLGDITRTNDTNVTLTLGGTPTGALITSTSFTLGWTGQLAVTRGGSGLSSSVLGDLWYGSAANTMAALAGNTTSTKKWLNQTGTGTVSAAPVWGTIANTDVSGLGTMSTQNANAVAITGGSATFTSGLDSTGATAGTGAANIIFRGSAGGASASTGLRILDTDESNTLKIVCWTDLTANSQLRIDVGNVTTRLLDISAANVTITAAGATFLATPNSANFAALLTDEYGSGNVPFETDGTFTPVLKFGGATTGITYSEQTGSYRRVGNVVYFNIRIVLTSKGSATGQATITGMPFTSAAVGHQTASGIFDALTSVNEPKVLILQSDTTLNLYNYPAPSPGSALQLLVDTNFQNGSSWAISGCYAI